MTSSLIDHLVEYRGIESNYTDAWGDPAIINPNTKRKLLGVMGYQVENQELLEQQVKQSAVNFWLSPLDRCK
jgi:4-alpha-glucanotransferase